MPENQRPEHDAERTTAMKKPSHPPSSTASERTTIISASAVNQGWPSEEPDAATAAPSTGSDASSAATVQNVQPASDVTRALDPEGAKPKADVTRALNPEGAPGGAAEATTKSSENGKDAAGQTGGEQDPPWMRAGGQGAGGQPGTPPSGIPQAGTPQAGANQSGTSQPGTPPSGIPQAGGSQDVTRNLSADATKNLGADATQAVTPEGQRTFQSAPPPGSTEATAVFAPVTGGGDTTVVNPGRGTIPPGARTGTPAAGIPMGTPPGGMSVPPGQRPGTFPPLGAANPAEATALGPHVVEQQPGGDAPASDADAKRRRNRKIGLVAASVVGALAVLWGVDLAVSSGNVPRGVTVAGVDVGGMSHSDAEDKLRDEISPRLEKPIKVKAGDVETELDPKAAGLELDWTATLDQAGSQPLSPITRVTSFFSTREVGIVSKADDAKVTAALEGLRGTTDHDPAEGTIRFEGAKPVAVDPKQGQKLEVPEASGVLLSSWANGNGVELPVATTPVKTTREGVAKALEEVATPAVASPVVIKGEGKDATLAPENLAAVLVFEPADDGSLNAKVDNGKVIEAAGPQLKETEKEGKDAEIVFDGGKPTVKESVDGLGVDWDKSLNGFIDVLKRADKREVKAEYKHTPAKVTTEQANKMGIKEVIGEFQTGGFAQDSGVNIRVVAEKVNGAIVKPGETFSLNGYTGPRGKAEGYVDAGIIENGAPGRAVGGGISQFATTLYNAYYYAGMKDAGHKEHSYWISRYPAGREATVFMDTAGNSLIDIKFTNPDDTGVAIQTIWTPSSIKIVLWGTKNYDVTGSTGEKTNPTDPQEIKKSTQPCVASAGAQGFTVTDTRTIKDRRTGQTRNETRTVKYDPSPKIVCEAPPA
ncbi:hypothetical protein CNX65_34425 [Actinosynnema pretiosum]|uniref:YoaR-like putative peptidoglycan binding domain-containing protein n=2 Tax=Actinosynnema pretiosum TaxID=42197 RepID=A0A290ZFH8_9PSEU|nr:hypothetical protein CNX65_34425 [Actinosynnema pretiosum]